MFKKLLNTLYGHNLSIAVATAYIVYLSLKPESKEVYFVYAFTICHIIIFEILFRPLFRTLTLSKIETRKSTIIDKLSAVILSTVIVLLYYNLLHGIFDVMIFSVIWIFCTHMIRKNTGNW
jgi:hypothetical protein